MCIIDCNYCVAIDLPRHVPSLSRTLSPLNNRHTQEDSDSAAACGQVDTLAHHCQAHVSTALDITVVFLVLVRELLHLWCAQMTAFYSRCAGWHPSLLQHTLSTMLLFFKKPCSSSSTGVQLFALL